MHFHADGAAHVHEHKHLEEHIHVHAAPDSANLTPWILFTIFVLGPCEPLIPILMYPAAKADIPGLILVTSIFSVITIGTMLGVVMISAYSLKRLPTQRLERYMHAIAGATIMLSGLAIQVLGL